MSWGVMPWRRRTGHTVLVAALRQFPGYQEIVQNLSAYQTPSGTGPQYVVG